MSSDLMEEKVVERFEMCFRREPSVVARAPGRVVLLGAHVDYNEGWVLPAAIDRSVWIAAAARSDQQVTIHSHEFGERAAFSLEGPANGSSSQDWLKYPKGVAWSLRQAGYPLSGIDVMIVSDVPMGAGVSSSAGLEMALLLVWEALSGFRLGDLERAQIGQKTENEYLKVGSGIMDQFASLNGAEDHLILLDCRNLTHELVPVPLGTTVIVADSGVRRQLAKINYNDRPEECKEAVNLLQRVLPNIRALRDVSAQEFELHAHRLPPILRRRARHVIEECQRVLAGAEALRQGDLKQFGALIRQSQSSSRDNYENSIPELDLLAAAAWQEPGCYGARFAGGGFGGVMQVLVKEEAVSQVDAAMNEAFAAEFGRNLSTFTCKFADGAQLAWL